MSRPRPGSRPRGRSEVTGADVSEATGVEVLNPEIHIATLAAGATARRSTSGSAWVAATWRPTGIPREAVPPERSRSTPPSRPIQRVAYSVENARLGKITDYEKLILEIWTNGAVSPDDALSRAARHLQSHFSHLAPEGREEEEEEVEAAGEGLPAGEPGQAARGAAAPRARHQRTEERTRS